MNQLCSFHVTGIPEANPNHDLPGTAWILALASGMSESQYPCGVWLVMIGIRFRDSRNVEAAKLIHERYIAAKVAES